MLSAEEYWQYSIQRYGKSEVKNLCLGLQNDYHVNVNILLLCGFLDKLSLRLRPSQFISLRKSIAELDQQIQLLRIKRVAAKHQDQASYRQLLEQELELERQQQVSLIKRVNQMKIENTDCSNLNAYILSISKQVEPELQQRLNSLHCLLN
jgi:uncharacterized protein (TIGR02444 family)